jgi:hypothetical protein
MYESIVVILRQIGQHSKTTQRDDSHFDREILRTFGQFIVQSVIPKGHDEILAAWQAQATVYGLGAEEGVEKHLVCQKRAARKNKKALKPRRS